MRIVFGGVSWPAGPQIELSCIQPMMMLWIPLQIQDSRCSVGLSYHRSGRTTYSMSPISASGFQCGIKYRKYSW